MTTVAEAYARMTDRLVELENERGGEARSVVLSIAQLVGVDLTRDQPDGQTWSPANMQRVVTEVRRLNQRIENQAYEIRRYQGLPESFVQ